MSIDDQIPPPRAGLLILCRHGQSETNHANVFTGLLDPPLTARGQGQARTVGQRLEAQDFKLDACFSAPSIRAKDTAQLILGEMGQVPPAVRYSDALLERDYGLLSGRNKDDVAREFGEEQTNLWRRSFEAVPPGGESLEMVVIRAWSFFEAEVVPLLTRGEQVLVVTSGNTARGIVMKLEKLSPAEVQKLQLGEAATRAYSWLNAEAKAVAGWDLQES
ncbi:phosphoglyceromutase [Meredithblackwellia eburnea MCA 4105]